MTSALTGHEAALYASSNASSNEEPMDSPNSEQIAGTGSTSVRILKKTL